MRRIGLMVSLLAGINCTACALWKKPPPPAFDRIAVEAEVAKEGDGRLNGDLHADTMVKSALVRGGAGLVAGGAGGAMIGASLSPGCGPFAGICVIANTIIGGVFGGVGGLLVGGVGGGMSGLGGADAGQVNQVLGRIEGSRDLEAELRTAMNASVPAEKQVAPEQAQAVVTARIDSFELRQHFSSRLSLRVAGSMTQAWSDDAEQETKTCKYKYWTPEQDVEDWLVDDGAPFDDAFGQSVETLASWMARDLEAFHSREARPETDEFPATCYQP